MLSAFQDELSRLELASRERGFIAGGSRFEAADSQIAFPCFIYLQRQHLRSVSRGERGSWTFIENPEWGETLLRFIGLMPLVLISSVWWCIVVILRFVCGTPHEGTRRHTYYCTLGWACVNHLCFCSAFLRPFYYRGQRESVIWSCTLRVCSVFSVITSRPFITSALGGTLLYIRDVMGHRSLVRTSGFGVMVRYERKTGKSNKFPVLCFVSFILNR